MRIIIIKIKIKNLNKPYLKPKILSTVLSFIKRANKYYCQALGHSIEWTPALWCGKGKIMLWNKCVSDVKAAAAKSLQSCPTLCDPRDRDCSPPGSPFPGILQARTLEWVAISFPNVWKWKVKLKSPSRVRLLATPWTAVYQAPQSMGLSR